MFQEFMKRKIRLDEHIQDKGIVLDIGIYMVKAGYLMLSLRHEEKENLAFFWNLIWPSRS